jgi:hypothetical protein
MHKSETDSPLEPSRRYSISVHPMREKGLKAKWRWWAKSPSLSSSGLVVNRFVNSQTKKASVDIADAGYLYF